MRAEEWATLPPCPICHVAAGERCRRIRLDRTVSTLLRPEPHADRLRDLEETPREARLRVAAEVLLQLGGVQGARDELRHKRAAAHPDWAAAVQRQIDQWTGAETKPEPVIEWCWTHGQRMAHCRVAAVRFVPCDPRPTTPPQVYMRNRGA